MILRSLSYGDEILDDYGEPGPLDPRELKGRCLTALAAGGAIADNGMPSIRNGNLTECSLRPGYFRSAYERVLPVRDHAEAWEQRSRSHERGGGAPLWPVRARSGLPASAGTTSWAVRLS